MTCNSLEDANAIHVWFRTASSQAAYMFLQGRFFNMVDNMRKYTAGFQAAYTFLQGRF